MTEQNEKVFRRKHDIYYITLLVYIIFFVVYILITGTITDETIEFGFRDPVVYIIGLFIVYTVVMLILNIVRNQRLILTPQRIVFRTRFRERSISISQITKIILKRERLKVNDGFLAVVKLRTSHRKRWIRIRVGYYEREKELSQEFKKMKHELKK